MSTPSYLIALAIAVQAHKPVFLWGKPGRGKSKTIQALARVLEQRLWTVLLQIREPSDLGGLPVITNRLEESDLGEVRLAPPLWAAQAHREGHGIIFFDEFNTSNPQLQSAALRVVLDAVVGDLELPQDKISFVAAGNRPSECTGAYDLTSAISNRWVHLDWPLDVDAYRRGLLGGWPDPQLPRLPEGWQAAIAAKRANVSSFLGVRPNLLEAMPADPAEQGFAWPSGRTWDDYVCTLLAASCAAGYDERSEVGRMLIQGSIGAGAATEFVSWFINLDLRDPEEYLADPMNVPLPKRQDQIMATLDSVAAASLSNAYTGKKREERYLRAWKILGRLLKTTPDITIPAARTLIENLRSLPNLERNLPQELEDIQPMLLKANVRFGART